MRQGLNKCLVYMIISVAINRMAVESLNASSWLMIIAIFSRKSEMENALTSEEQAH